VSGVAGIVLAAGASRRHGSPKQLRRLGATTLVRRAAEAVKKAGCDPTIVVLGAFSEQIAPELAGARVDAVVNSAWEEGMGASLRRGIVRLREIAPAAAAALVVLADQPRVGPAALRALAERLARGPEPAVASRYEGVLGPPAIFAASLFGALESLSGDEGARSLLRSGEVPVAAIDLPEAAFDVDVAKDV
jgi:molybdenum cofactor cytidylyltransferase